MKDAEPAQEGVPFPKMTSDDIEINLIERQRAGEALGQPGDIKKRARWRRAGRKRLGFSHLSHISSMSVSNATAAFLTEGPAGELRRRALSWRPATA